MLHVCTHVALVKCNVSWALDSDAMRLELRSECCKRRREIDQRRMNQNTFRETHPNFRAQTQIAQSQVLKTQVKGRREGHFLSEPPFNCKQKRQNHCDMSIRVTRIVVYLLERPLDAKVHRSRKEHIEGNKNRPGPQGRLDVTSNPAEDKSHGERGRGLRKQHKGYSKNTRCGIWPLAE